MRDINWGISFDITIDGEEAQFSDLTESEQKKILDDLAGDYYYGTFTGDGNPIDEKHKNLWVCEHCLAAIESREGNQATLKHYVDEDDDVESKCDWCEENGFDTLYELV